jgi:hypothetical protein
MTRMSCTGKPADDAVFQRLAHAFLDRGHEYAGDHAAFDTIDEFEPARRVRAVRHAA